MLFERCATITTSRIQECSVSPQNVPLLPLCRLLFSGQPMISHCWVMELFPSFLFDD